MKFFLTILVIVISGVLVWADTPESDIARLERENRELKEKLLQAERELQAIQREGWSPVAILLTQSHFDHILGIPGIRAQWPELPIYCHPADTANHEATERLMGMTFPTVWSFGNVQAYSEGDVVKVGALSVEVLHTPGHTPGSVCLKVENNLFTGDTLFQGSMGRTDLPGGSLTKLMVSLSRLAHLPGDMNVYPGHMDSSTLEQERKFNYYLKQAMESL